VKHALPALANDQRQSEEKHTYTWASREVSYDELALYFELWHSGALGRIRYRAKQSRSMHMLHTVCIRDSHGLQKQGCRPTHLQVACYCTRCGNPHGDSLSLLMHQNRHDKCCTDKGCGKTHPLGCIHESMHS